MMHQVPGKPPLKLNLGCGLTSPEGWVNIDNSWVPWLWRHSWLWYGLRWLHLLPERIYETPWPTNVMRLDVRRGLPFEDGTVDVIYASHLLEHLTHKEAEQLLLECYRVMKPGALIRLVVPDLYQLATRYVEQYQSLVSQDKYPLSLESMPGDRFLNSLYMFEPGFLDQDPFWVRLIRRIQSKNIHKWMYDSMSLSALLKSVGFSEIERCECGRSRIPGIELLDRPGQFVDAFCVEAMK